MRSRLMTLEIKYEQDVVHTRQRARHIAALLGFDGQDQTRIATAVSEIARNAYQYGGGGHAEFAVAVKAPATLEIRIEDRGPGISRLQDIWDGRYQSSTGMGMGLIGARRLMDRCDVETRPGQGVRVSMEKRLPGNAPAVTAQRLREISEELTRVAPVTPFDEVRRQNQELLLAMEQVRERETELLRLNTELDETNKGVIQLYAELDDKADSLQEASELKSAFLSNVTHEFRTPLGSIVGLSQFLLDRLDGDLTTEQEKQVTFIHKSAQTLMEMVNDLLDLAKIESGKTEIRANAFTVADTFAALRGMFRPLVIPGGVALVFEDCPDIPSLHTDEGKVSQILRNLISNALKFTETGEIRVRCEVDPGDLISFTVSDTGVGIAPEDQDRVFEEFSQVEGALQRKVKGTGLGLPLSRKLARLLGGDVTLESAPGVGSTFTATIPRTYSEPG
ncbi:sensor histidine kinase [Capsulimonas corticalis]|uniref:Circadian input-output histidine kinase CikA n=1 Tax=Capsulimonas corticalis TaxID=2219043 RepID=A0A402D2W1_9BACT|nr:ATP-binding protein [Capsulimonas corticalis]BDI28389.1 sensor histidine kinase [Capsulimonas corticalis]